MGLTVLTRTNLEEYYATNLASFGVKVSRGTQNQHQLVNLIFLKSTRAYQKVPGLSR
jgi:hypothetical protein